jgi:hypothetical protein
LCGDVVGATVAHAVVELVVEVVPHIAVEGPYGLHHGGVGVEESALGELVAVGLLEEIVSAGGQREPCGNSAPIYNILVFMTC